MLESNPNYSTGFGLSLPRQEEITPEMQRWRWLMEDNAVDRLHIAGVFEPTGEYCVLKSITSSQVSEYMSGIHQDAVELALCYEVVSKGPGVGDHLEVGNPVIHLAAQVDLVEPNAKSGRALICHASDIVTVCRDESKIADFFKAEADKAQAEFERKQRVSQGLIIEGDGDA